MGFRSDLSFVMVNMQMFYYSFSGGDASEDEEELPQAQLQPRPLGQDELQEVVQGRVAKQQAHPGRSIERTTDHRGPPSHPTLAHSLTNLQPKRYI